MDYERACHLYDELRQLVAQHPGAGATLTRRANEIQSIFIADVDSTAYLREKVVAVVSGIDQWSSTRKWQKYGSGPHQLRGLLMNDLSKLKRAIDQVYRHKDPPSLEGTR